MRTPRRRLLLGAGLAATGVATPIRAQVLAQGQAKVEPLAFGALYPFSGGLALLGDESFRGLDLATDERNAAGGLLGRQIRLARADAADPTQAAAEARRLMTAEHVAGIFGTYAASVSATASQATEVAGVPFFELGAIGEAITARGFKYLFRSCATADAFATLAVQTVAEVLAGIWNVEPAALKLATLFQDGVNGSAVAALQEKHCAARGLNLVASLSYAAGTIDLASMVQRLRGAAADVVLHTGVFNDIAPFYRAMKQAGWWPRMVIGSGAGYSLNDTMQVVGTDFEGTMNVDFPQYRVSETAAPHVAAVAAAYQRKYGAPPRSGHSLANYVGARLFYDAIARSGATDKDKIRAAVLATDIPIGGTASGWGAAFDEHGQNTRAFPLLMQWQGGVPATVFPAAAAVAQPRGRLSAQ